MSGSARSIGLIYNITPQNCRQLCDTVENVITCWGIPIDHLVLQRIVPQGRGRGTTKFTIGCSHAVAALEEIERLDAIYRLGVFFEDPFPYCVVPGKFWKYLNRCEWGFTRAAVDGEGNLSRCGADPRYRLGNVVETPLLELWNSSPILKSFRGREYLPDQCRGCELLERCGGGCALSCEIERDHGPDYLYYERARPTIRSGTALTVRPARVEDLSDILRMEWASFPEYEFKFTPESVLRWYKYAPAMFQILEDSQCRAVGYACVAPLTERGFAKVREGRACSLQELEVSDVDREARGGPVRCHVEVLATIADVRSRAGRTLIKKVGELLLDRGAEVLTASPITYMGVKLCEYFGLKAVGTKRTESRSYDIYMASVDKERLRGMLERL